MVKSKKKNEAQNRRRAANPGSRAGEYKKLMEKRRLRAEAAREGKENETKRKGILAKDDATKHRIATGGFYSSAETPEERELVLLRQLPLLHSNVGSKSNKFVDNVADLMIDEARPSDELQLGQYISESSFSLTVKDSATFVDASVKMSSQDVTASVSAARMLTKPTELGTKGFGVGKKRASTAAQMVDDATLYKPIGAIFAKKCIPAEVCKNASHVLQLAATTSNRRLLTNGGFEPPQTGIVGYYDYATHPTQHKCRETEFTRANWPKVANGCAPLIKRLDEVYAQFAPRHHQLQMETIPEAYKLFGTCFSTITVNKNFRTAAHVDRGDFKSGLGVVAVLEGHGFMGCYLAVPKLKLAFDMEPGDAVLFDTGYLHGNTEVYVQISEEELPDILLAAGIAFPPTLMTDTLGCKRQRDDAPSFSNVDHEGSDSNDSGNKNSFKPNIIRKRGNRIYIEVPFGHSGDLSDPATRLAHLLEPRWLRISIVAYLRSGLATPLCWQDRVVRQLQGQKLLKTRMDSVVNLARFGLKASDTQQPSQNVFVPNNIAKILTQCQTEALLFAGDKASYPSMDQRTSAASLRSSFVKSVSGCILALPMGYGKTLIGLLCAFNHFYQFTSEDVLVVAPKSVLTHWNSEANKWAAEGLQLPNIVSSADADGAGVDFENGMLLYNQHIYQYEHNPATLRVGHLFIVNFERVRGLRRTCPALAPGLILIDEGHRIGSYASSASLAQYKLRRLRNAQTADDSISEDEEYDAFSHESQCLPSLCSMTTTQAGGQRRRAIIFTGTPMQNNAHELYRLVEFICPAISITLPKTSFQQKIAPLELYLSNTTKGLQEDLETSTGWKLFKEAVSAQQFVLEWLRGFLYRAPLRELISTNTAASGTYQTRDLVIVCNLSERQQRYIERYNLYGTSDPSLSANEHRSPHLTAHPVCLLSFLATGSRILQQNECQSFVDHYAEDTSYMESVIQSLLSSGQRTTAYKLDEDVANWDAKAFIGNIINITETDSAIFQTLCDSGKLLATLSIICRAAIHRQEKVVVFTQYTIVQRLLWELLAVLGVKCSAVSGQDTSDQRDAAIEVFRDCQSLCNVLLITSKTGSYGLDLTCANHLIIFDSWWNPQIDAQAAARVDRKNQVRDVTIYRLATVHEEQIVLKLHTKKLLLFDCIVNNVHLGTCKHLEQQLTITAAQPTQDANLGDELEEKFWRCLMKVPLSVIDGTSSPVPAVVAVKRYWQTDSKI